MIRLSANLSKKVPIPGLDYSSQNYGASLEIEVSDADKPDAIQGRIRELYGLPSDTIDEQIAAAAPAPRLNTGRAQTVIPRTNGNGHNRLPARQNTQTVAQPTMQPQQQQVAPQNGNGRNAGRASAMNSRRTGATHAQQKCIFAICKNLNLDLTAVLADFNVSKIEDLGVKEASQLIDNLKAQQAPQQ